MSLFLPALNLNLLVALDALLEARSVTAAARAVGVSQPAMSRSLKQLRELFGDPLLVRSKDGLLLTPRAARLREPLHRTLASLARVVDDGVDFDPRSSTRRFIVEMPDYLFGLLGPALFDEVAREAPHVTLDLRAADRDGILERLERGAADVIVHACVEPPAGLTGRGLILDHFAVALRKGHPRAPKRKLSLRTYAELAHCLIAITDDVQLGTVDLALEEHGLQRHVACRVRSFLAAAIIVAESDAILTAPNRLLRWFAQHHDLEIYEPPIPLHDFEYIALWHERFESEPAHAWLRGLLERVAAPHLPDPGDRDWRELWGHAGSRKRRKIQKRAGGRAL